LLDIHIVLRKYFHELLIPVKVIIYTFTMFFHKFLPLEDDKNDKYSQDNIKK